MLTPTASRSSTGGVERFDFKDLFVLDLANNHQGSLEHGRRVVREVGAVAGRDDVRWAELDGMPQEALFPKTRPDDFIREIEHIQASLADGTPSPISLERGLDTMLVIAAAHLSAQQRRNVKIDYSAGYRPESLSLC